MRIGIFDELRGVYLLMKHCVECLILLLKQNDLERDFKHAKMRSFSSDFQTLIKKIKTLIMSY